MMSNVVQYLKSQRW